jgi:hypothetical protein
MVDPIENSGLDPVLDRLLVGFRIAAISATVRNSSGTA